MGKTFLAGRSLSMKRVRSGKVPAEGEEDVAATAGVAERAVARVGGAEYVVVGAGDTAAAIGRFPSKVFFEYKPVGRVRATYSCADSRSSGAFTRPRRRRASVDRL